MSEPATTVVNNHVLHKVTSESGYGTTLLKVASQFYYVFSDTFIGDLSTELEANPEILSLGVLDSEKRLLGIIERAYFFYLLGRPFGRDILIRKSVIDITQEAHLFPHDMNIFTAAGELGKLDVPRDRVQYYCLTNQSRQFYGMFSSIDLLSFMSQITQQDITLAADLQNRMVKESFTESGLGIQFFGFTQSAKGMGGDFYGVYQIGKDDWFFTLCDVSGKGVAASVITSMLWGMLRTADWRRGLGSIIQEINLALIQTFHLEKYLTGIFGIFSPETKEVRLADMGHSLGFLQRNGRIVKLEGAHLNLPVGIELNLQPKIVRLKLQENDLLTFMTDGIPEQTNEKGDLQEEEEWIQIMNSFILKENEPREKILEQFSAFRGILPQADDLSALFVKIE